MKDKISTAVTCQEWKPLSCQFVDQCIPNTVSCNDKQISVGGKKKKYTGSFRFLLLAKLYIRFIYF